jgi:hypothetical protein
MIVWNKTDELLPESGRVIVERPPIICGSEHHDADRVMMIKVGTTDEWLPLLDGCRPSPPKEWVYLADVLNNVDELAIAAEAWKRSRNATYTSEAQETSRSLEAFLS